MTKERNGRKKEENTAKKKHGWIKKEHKITYRRIKKCWDAKKKGKEKKIGINTMQSHKKKTN